MAKDLRYRTVAPGLLLVGVDELAEAVKTTPGPRCRKVSLEKIKGRPW